MRSWAHRKESLTVNLHRRKSWHIYQSFKMRILDQLCKRVKNVKEQTACTVLHTDQGAVYSSRAFSRTHSNYNIIRSMSRAGTPTDNPIIESLNGWMKAELILDFGISKVSNLKKTLDQYVLYFNSERFAAALDYKTPIQYRTELGF